jgi:hypothetical protein
LACKMWKPGEQPGENHVKTMWKPCFVCDLHVFSSDLQWLNSPSNGITKDSEGHSFTSCFHNQLMFIVYQDVTIVYQYHKLYYDHIISYTTLLYIAILLIIIMFHFNICS